MIAVMASVEVVSNVDLKILVQIGPSDRLSGDVTAAKPFFSKIIKHQGRAPATITLDAPAVWNAVLFNK